MVFVVVADQPFVDVVHVDSEHLRSGLKTGNVEPAIHWVIKDGCATVLESAVLRIKINRPLLAGDTGIIPEVERHRKEVAIEGAELFFNVTRIRLQRVAEIPLRPV